MNIRTVTNAASGFGPLLVPKAEAFASIGVGNTKGHDLINQGKLRARKIGSRTYIEASSLREFVDSLPMLPAKAA